MQRDTPTPLYAQIASTLRSEMAEGRFEPSGRLPSEEDLRTRFQVSRVTVRLALAALEEDGLIDRRKGKGTFTRGKQVRHALDTLRSFHESLKVQGFSASIRFIKARTDAEAPLGLHVTRLHLADGQPIAVGLSQLPIELAGQDWAGLGDQPLYAVVERALRSPLVRADFAVGLGTADGPTAGLLETAVGEPLLLLERRSFASDGRQMDQSTFWIRPERYQFTVASRYTGETTGD